MLCENLHVVMLIWASQCGSCISYLMVTTLKNQTLSVISPVLNSFEKLQTFILGANKDLEVQLLALFCADLCPPCVSYSGTRGLCACAVRVL